MQKNMPSLLNTMFMVPSINLKAFQFTTNEKIFLEMSELSNLKASLAYLIFIFIIDFPCIGKSSNAKTFSG